MAGSVSSFLGGLGGGAIGSAVVKLYLDNDQYKTELASSEGSLAKSTTGMGSKMAAFKAVAAASFAVAGYAAIRFAGDAVAAAREHEIAVSQLRDAIGGNITALEDQANALQMVTGFSDEAIFAADTILSRYDLTATQLQQLNPLILDYARATGQDAATAAGGLGKALLGNTRALKSIGIEFTATGDRTKDLNTLMGLLQDKVGGVAEEFGKTSQGQAEILRQKFDELQETVGKLLIPALNVLTSILQWILDNLPAVTATVVLFSAAWVVANWAEIAAGIQALAASVAATAASLGAALLAIAPYAAAVALLGEVVLIATGKLKGLNGALDEFAHNVAADAIKAINQARVHFTDAGKAVSNFANLTTKKLKEFREQARSAFDDVIFDLGNLSKNMGVSRKDFVEGTKAMLERAKELNQALKTISKEKWVNDAYIKFLSDQGPGYLVAFAGLNKEQQRRMQADWEATNKKTNEAKGRFDDIIGVLDKLNGKKSRATVTVEYKVAGIDPRTLPGLGVGAGAGAG